MVQRLRFLGVLQATMVLSSCVPAHLQKYRSEPTAQAPSGPRRTNARPEEGRGEVEEQEARSSELLPLEIVDKQTFRFHASETAMWEISLAVLLKDYNVTVVDRQSGLMTTEWVSYGLEGAIQRNRVSLLIRRKSSQAVEVTIHNNVEKLGTGPTAGTWLAAGDGSEEGLRIARNIASYLDRPFKQGVISKDRAPDSPESL